MKAGAGRLLFPQLVVILPQRHFHYRGNINNTTNKLNILPCLDRLCIKIKAVLCFYLGALYSSLQNKP